MAPSRTLFTYTFAFFISWLGLHLLLTLFVGPSIPAEGDSLDYRLVFQKESAIWDIRKDTYNTSLPHLWDTLRSPFVELGAGWGRFPNIVVFVLFGLLMFWASTRTLGLSRPWGYFSTWLLLVTPTYYMQAATFMVDLPANLVLAGASLLLFQQILNKKKSLSAKETGKVALLIQLGISCHWWPWPQGALIAAIWMGYWRKALLKQPSVLFLFLFLISFPYPAFILVRNFVETGNPFFPSLNGLFQSSWMSELRSAELFRSMGGGDYGKSPLDLLLLPFRLALKSQPFDYPGGGLLLVFGPALFLPIRKMLSFVSAKTLQRIHLSRVFALVFLGVWFFSIQNTRFLGVAYFWLILFGVLFLREVFFVGKSNVVRKLICIGFGFYLLVFSYMAIGNQYPGVRFVRMDGDQEAWRHLVLPRYRWVQQMNQQAYRGIGLVSRTGDASYLKFPVIYLPPHVFSNFHISEKEEICQLVRQVDAIYGGSSDFQKLKKQVSCLNSFVLNSAYSDSGWAVYERKKRE